MADTRWPPFDNQDVITTSYDAFLIFANLKGNISVRAMSPLSIIVIAFILANVWKGIGPLGQEDKKKNNKYNS